MNQPDTWKNEASDREDQVIQRPSARSRLLFDGHKLHWYGSAPDDWNAFSGHKSGNYRESVKGFGPIPQGEYTVDPNVIELDPPAPKPDPILWGKHRVKIEPIAMTVKRMRDCFPEVRSGFYIHGGRDKGSAGCVELVDDVDEYAFFQKLKAYGKKIELKVKFAEDLRCAYEEPKCPY